LESEKAFMSDISLGSSCFVWSLEEGGGGFGLTIGVLVNLIIGFLGVLHMEVFSQRLEQEFDAQASELD
jgi:translation elongation factor EF-4